MSDLERRYVPRERGAVEVRQASGDGNTLEGYAAVFDSPSRPLAEGGRRFQEKFLPGAFSDALQDADVLALLNHDSDNILGRRSAGTLTVEEDGRGLRYEIDLGEDHLSDFVARKVGRREINGSSFTFRVAEGGEEWRQRPGKPPLRVISKVSYVGDVGPVTRPAYGATTVSKRAMQEAAEVPETDPSSLSRSSLRHLISENREEARRLVKRGRELIEESDETFVRGFVKEARRMDREHDQLMDRVEALNEERERLGKALDAKRRRQAGRRTRKDNRRPLQKKTYRIRRKEIRTRNTLEAEKLGRTALHEAGHAVMATLTGRRVTKVLLLWKRRGGDFRPAGGRCQYESSSPSPLISAAGEAAVRLSNNSRLDPTDGTGSDYHRTRDALELRGSEFDQAETVDRAEVVMKAHATLVRAVQRALLGDGQLEGEEVRRIMWKQGSRQVEERMKRVGVEPTYARGSGT